MLFKIGERISDKTAEIIRRNTNTQDRTDIAEIFGVSESMIRKIVYVQEAVTTRTQAPMMLLGQLAFSSTRRKITEADRDGDYLIEGLNMEQSRIIETVERMGFEPLEEAV